MLTVQPAFKTKYFPFFKVHINIYLEYYGFVKIVYHLRMMFPLFKQK